MRLRPGSTETVWDCRSGGRGAGLPRPLTRPGGGSHGIGHVGARSRGGCQARLPPLRIERSSGRECEPVARVHVEGPPNLLPRSTDRELRPGDGLRPGRPRQEAVARGGWLSDLPARVGQARLTGDLRTRESRRAGVPAWEGGPDRRARDRPTRVGWSHGCHLSHLPPRRRGRVGERVARGEQRKGVGHDRAAVVPEVLGFDGAGDDQGDREPRQFTLRVGPGGRSAVPGQRRRYGTAGDRRISLRELRTRGVERAGTWALTAPLAVGNAASGTTEPDSQPSGGDGATWGATAVPD